MKVTKLKQGILALYKKNVQKYWTSNVRTEKLKLNVSSTGDWHFAPKIFQSRWNCISYGDLFRKNSYTSCTAHLFHRDGNKQVEKIKCHRAHQLALLPEALGCRAAPVAPAAYRSDPPLTLWLHQGSRPQLILREWFKDLETESWQEKVRPLLNWAPSVLGKWERVWEVAERMSRALGNKLIGRIWTGLVCFNWKRERLNHNVVQICKISRRDW